MHFEGPGIYHIYNRGNFKQQLFFSAENYFYFLNKCHKYIKPYCDILGWCLMPNHFHFLIDVLQKSLTNVKIGNIEIPSISNGFRILLSSYAKGINRQWSRTGNLFQQKTQSKIITDKDYLMTAINYVHQNPVKAGLVKLPQDWPFSSYPDLLGMRNGNLCEKQKVLQLLGPGANEFIKSNLVSIQQAHLREIFRPGDESSTSYFSSKL